MYQNNVNIHSKPQFIFSWQVGGQTMTSFLIIKKTIQVLFKSVLSAWDQQTLMSTTSSTILLTDVT